MAAFAYARGLRRSAGTVSALGPRAAARRRGYRTKVSGPRLSGGFPAGPSRPPPVERRFPRQAAYAVTRRQARGALRAPLKEVEKLLTGQRLDLAIGSSGWI